MGQALYRKYRSKNLGEIIGQEPITKALGQALKTGGISHAYLLTGPRGVGKTSVARILAHEVNGLPYNDDSTHLDIVEIDAASNRRIDEIRELRERVHVAPSSVKYKVYIIDEVHMLTREAMSALLKTLEEPPAHVIFILATTEAYKLPETIVSRTQRFTFRPIEAAKVVEHLHSIAQKEKIDIDDDALELIAEHGEGSFRDSISLLDQVSAGNQKVSASRVLEMLGEAPAGQIATLEQAISEQNAGKLVKTLHGMAERGYEPTRIAKQLAQLIRNGLLSSKSVLSYQDSLELLSRLLDVPATTDPGTALELALLKSINLTSPEVSSPSQAPPAATSKQQAKPRPAEKTEDSKPKTAPLKTEVADRPSEIPEARQTDEETWQRILAAAKQKHNTIYGVLRMAKPSWEADSLTLSFSFAFHQKKIDEPKNREIVSEIIMEVTGRKVSVVCIFDKDAQPVKLSADEIPQNNPTFTSITNIFGGAELIES